MPVVWAGSGAAKPNPSDRVALGLSPRTQQLWLAAMRYRSLADALAASQSRQAAS